MARVGQFYANTAALMHSLDYGEGATNILLAQVIRSSNVHVRVTRRI